MHLICTSLNLSLKQKLEKDEAVNFFCGHRYSQRPEYTLNPFTSSPVTPVNVHVCFFFFLGFVRAIRVSVCVWLLELLP